MPFIRTCLSIFLLIFLFSCSPSTTTLVHINLIPQGERIIRQLKYWHTKGEMVGGELLILKGGRNVFHACVGWKDNERKDSFEKNTICRIRSMTKPVLGTAVLMLVEKGKISLDDKVSKYIDEYNEEKTKAITIRQLLTHTAGFEQPGYPEGFTSYNSLDEIIKAITETGPIYEPGTRFHYSDAGSSTLAAIITRVTGAPSELFLKKEIIDPLKMNDTYYQLAESDSVIKNRMSCVYLKDEEWREIWNNNDPPPVNFFRGAGGLLSTATDYAKFLQMWKNGGILNGNRFLKAYNVHMALTPTKLSIEAGNPYGMHMVRYDDYVFGHSGYDGTIAWVDMQNDLIVCYFTQSRGTETVTAIFPIIYQILGLTRA